MKRSARDAAQEAGRGKHARQHADITDGSITVVQQEPVLALQRSRNQDDMVVDDSHAVGREYTGSPEEDTDNDEDVDGAIDLEEEETIEGLLLALDSKATHTRIKALKLLLNRLSGLTNSQHTQFMEIAQRMLYTENDKGAKILLIQVIQNILEATAVNGRSAVEHLLNQLQADSTEVRVQVYDAISYIIKIGRLPRSNMSDINTIRALITTSITELKDRHHRIRSAVLQLVAQLAPLVKLCDLTVMPIMRQHPAFSQHDIQLIVRNYVTDPEPRVRKNACKALLELHRQGFKLALEMYDVAVLALQDDYQEVRMEGLDIIYLLSELYPDQIVQNPFASQLQATRLVDDSFIRICDMVNDSSVTVRAKACSLLGKFRAVDYKFLSQTFSKKIMARLRMDVAPKNLAAGPAQKQAQRAKLIATPEGDQDVTAQEVRLLDSGACGAFVHGLEDEYQDVRNAAINSICELCLQNPEFSLLALDYMVDMFMDEIDYVRLNALTSLFRIGSRAPITFDTEQLQIALGVLEDADRDVRESTQRMLEVVVMATADGMTSFMTSIESNMKRFPEDQLSIYQCIKAVARRHGGFVEAMVSEMLHLSKMYLPIEENVESMQYGGHLILIFNAAIPNPRILQMLPKYTYKHYIYLRDKYPSCFPEPSEIPCPGTQPLQDLASALTMAIADDAENRMKVEDSDSRRSESASASTSAYVTTIAAMRVQTEQDAESFYGRALNNLDRIYSLWGSKQKPRTRHAASNHRAMILQQIVVCQRDLRYIVNVHAKQGRNAEFADIFLECCDLLIQIQDSHDTPAFVIQAPTLSAQLFRLSYYMDHTFLGLNATAKVSINYFRVLANLVWFFGMAQTKAGTGISSAGVATLSSSPTWPIDREHGQTREYLQSMLQMAIKRITDLLQQMDQPEVDHERVQRHRHMLLDLRISMLRAFKSPSTQEIIMLMSGIVKFVPLEINFHCLNLERIGAQITKPLPNRDNPLDVHPSFPFLVNVEGVIQHVRDTTGIAVQVTFPQNVVRHYYPPLDHFTLINGDIDTRFTDLEDEKTADDANDDSIFRTSTYRLRTSIEIYPDAAWGLTPTELRITVARSFQSDVVGHDEFICRFAEGIASEKRQKQYSQSMAGTSMEPAARQPQQQRSQQHSHHITVSMQQRSFEEGAGSGLMRHQTSPASSASSSLNPEQNQSTLEISKGISYYVSRRAMFSH
ncbi:Integrator complex subunit 4 [Gamsiella multidivaricata]|nr:Integrator complex subunit 4 [Gamsiella multidivaricata]